MAERVYQNLSVQLCPLLWMTTSMSSCYLSGGRVAGRRSRSRRLGWTVGALRGQSAAALGLTETFAVLFADLQRNERSGQNEHADPDGNTPTLTMDARCKSFIKCHPADSCLNVTTVRTRITNVGFFYVEIQKVQCPWCWKRKCRMLHWNSWSKL